LLCTWSLAAATNESSNSPESSMTGISILQCSSSSRTCYKRWQALRGEPLPERQLLLHTSTFRALIRASTPL
jgi:hypothetical protein